MDSVQNPGLKTHIRRYQYEVSKSPSLSLSLYLSLSLSLVTLSLLAACSGHKHKESAAGGNGESPVSVKFTQSQGASLADINNRLDFGGQVAVSSYDIGLNCGSNSYHLRGGRMLIRAGESNCATLLNEVVVTDQHGLTATFRRNPGQTTPPFFTDVTTLLPTNTAQYPNLRMDITGGVVTPLNGQGVSYTYTLRDSAQGNNTVGSNDGDTGIITQVSFAGVPLPDVSPNKVSAWAAIDSAGAGTFSAVAPAESDTPCGTAADYAVELYAQTGATTTELAASGISPSGASDTNPYPLAATNTASGLISDCRGLTTNLYLKLSCTSKADSSQTSFKLVSLQSQIPNSPYTDIGSGYAHFCANATDVSGMAALSLHTLTASSPAFLPAAPGTLYVRPMGGACRPAGADPIEWGYNGGYMCLDHLLSGGQNHVYADSGCTILATEAQCH